MPRALTRRPSSAAVVTFVTVGGMVAFVAWQLHPSLLLSNTTTAGGDTGAHVAIPAYLRSHLLPEGRITGWSAEWFGGYPSLIFYFPLPSLAIALTSFVIPYNIAFKLVTAVGLLCLPVAAWAFGRLSRLEEPAPSCLAVATLPFLFDRSFTIYGGNIASTLAGEFAFSISLSLALVFLGVVAGGLPTRRRRGLAAGLFALCLLCHLIPALFAAAGAAVLLLLRPTWQRARRVVTGVVVGAAIAGFWAIPFVARQSYTTDMGFQKVTDYAHSLFPAGQHWVLVLAAAGAASSVLRRRKPGVFLLVMAVGSALAFRFDPTTKLYNGRLLPFWALCLYLLAGLGAAEIGVLVARGWRRLGDRLASDPLASERVLGARFTGRGLSAWLPGRPGTGGAGARPGALSTPLVVGALASILVVLPLVNVPSWLASPTSVLPSWLTVSPSFVPSWVKWNYSGYEAKPAYPEYRSIIDTMARVGRTHGCGRAMWEYEPEENQMGTTTALMLLPYWTDQCIDSMEGLLYESSATTPYHFLNQSELSLNPSRPMGGIPYGPLDVPTGVQHLQMLGVRYYMAVSAEAQQEAGQDPALTQVAKTGPWPVSENGQTVRQTWRVYQVADSAQVTPLTEQPVVLRPGDHDPATWLSQAVGWYDDPSVQDVQVAAGGPAGWARVGSSTGNLPRTPVPETTVSRIRTGQDSIDFDVSRTGSPVLVKTSYFPNWQADGARGPWRVAPNLMVVVPTSRHVSLHFGWTPVDVVGWLVTLAGLSGLVLLLARPRRGGKAAGSDEEAAWVPPPRADAPWARLPEVVGASRR